MIDRRTVMSALGLTPIASCLTISRSFAAEAAENFDALYGRAAAEGEVVYYSSDSQGSMNNLSEWWKSHLPKVKLTILRKQGPDIVTDIEAQHAAGQNRVDVVDIGIPFMAAIWKQKGYYEKYSSPAIEKLPVAFRDPDGAYFAKSIILLSSAYNTQAFSSRDQLPKRLADFLDPKWKGKMVIADPNSAAQTRTFFLGLLKTGKIDWSFIERLGKQDVLLARTNGEAMRLLAAGERSLSPMLSSQNIFVGHEKGQNVNYFVVDEGAIINEEMSGIMAGTRHPNAARLLQNVVASAEGQQVLLEPEKQWPTNPDAKLPTGMPKLSDLKTIQVDLTFLADEKISNDFLTRFGTAFGRS